VTKKVWLIAGGITLFVAVVAGVLLVAAGSGTTAPTEAMAPPRFVEEASAAGINHRYEGDWTFFVGGGTAVFDCNDDARPDLYFAGGENRAALFRNESVVGGRLSFAPIADEATDLTEVTGAYPLDVDGDGHTDLAVLRLGENVLLRGLGDCRFERANDAWRLDGGNEWTAAFSAKWEDEAPLPTLAFGNYVALDENNEQTATCSDNSLVRPSGPLTYAAPSALSPGWCTLSSLFSDWDRSGRRDLRFTNDRHYYRDGEEQLWRIEDGEPPHLYTREEGWQKLQIWGMGIASHDVTGDGYPEVFLTSQGDNKLRTLTDGPAQPSYGDIAIRRGVTAHRPFTGDEELPSTAWHAEFQDVNNDGFVDLFIAKGNVEAMPDFAAADPNNLLLGQPDGTFVEAAADAGIVHFDRTRGGALVDLNLDGMLDLVEVNRSQNVKLWRSLGWGDADEPESMGRWLAVGLVQPGPNRDAIGSWIELRLGDLVVARELTIGGGHAGGQLGWVHFGLGPANAAEVRVIWPNGETGPWLQVDSDQFVTIERGASEATAWVPED
jgi:hypothetical protein